MPNAFDHLDSNVSNYCRQWPVVFDRAVGSHLYDESGRAWLDFFTGAGALNYGHNHPDLKKALLAHLERDGLVQGLDMWTGPRRLLLSTLDEVVLRPRGLDYKVQFSGPAGTTAVEAALKLARKITGRRRVVGFVNGFHGMTLGAQSLAGSARRHDTGVPPRDTVLIPFDDGTTPSAPGADRWAVLDGDGTDPPAAVVVETVQGEGGVNVARAEWLRSLSAACRRNGVLLIVDDVQMGCGRTGPFFSFEAAGVRPDIVCLSKSLSGYGLPLGLTLFRRELDRWRPGEHSGTFRGVGPALLTAARALELFWADDALADRTAVNAAVLARSLADIAGRRPDLDPVVRGRGMVWGLALRRPGDAAAVAREAFRRGLLVETAGPRDEVVKLMPALTIPADELARGLRILADAVDALPGAPVARRQEQEGMLA
ncbi:diaminobutyrate--2-oxoglutarate transaminase [Saccharothrix sp. S26]|uniref:diaminobutyrate--2-oxoglutarate transaminase n=1 Tax=Saccharothrix sp. S26 TaxID=2907215 RepID=UPI001F2D8CA7|nr:diaminobutyrate--2-oxoglutarate transaminase [Saccharothrix sp. S26]MCE6995241.1 diaminobutyrate--2-oxoglutarate transaminase [Saccharothrix sp. S26]